MKDFKKLWRDLARNNKHTAYDTFVYCVLKALNSKSNASKTEILHGLLTRTFTPISNKNTLKCQGKHPYEAIRKCRGMASISHNILGTKAEDFFENKMEESEFRSLVRSVDTSKIGTKYVYVFLASEGYTESQMGVSYFQIRKALSQECSLHPKYNYVVQVKKIKTTDLYPVLTEISNNGFGSQIIAQISPEHKNNMTALVTYPMHSSKKQKFREFSWLKYD